MRGWDDVFFFWGGGFFLAGWILDVLDTVYRCLNDIWSIRLRFIVACSVV